jgi:hypothetical protein
VLRRPVELAGVDRTALAGRDFRFSRSGHHVASP